METIVIGIFRAVDKAAYNTPEGERNVSLHSGARKLLSAGNVAMIAEVATILPQNEFLERESRLS